MYVCVGIYEFEQVPEDGEGQGSLACCSPWGGKESDMTEWPDNQHMYVYIYTHTHIYKYIAIYKPPSKHKLKIYNRYTHTQRKKSKQH